MRPRAEDVLAGCLELLDQGKSVEECLAQVRSGGSDLGSDFEGLLRAATRLRAAPKLHPRPGFRLAARARILAAAAAPRRRRLLDDWWQRSFATAIVRTAAAALAAVVVVGGTVTASESSGPGDVLYPAKLAIEQAQVAVTPSEEARAELYLMRADRRLAELVDETESGDYSRADNLVDEYAKAATAAIAAAQRAPAQDQASSAAEAIDSRIQGQLKTLRSVMDKVPSGSRPGLESAVTAVQGELPTKYHIGQGESDNPSDTPDATPERADPPRATPPGRGQDGGRPKDAGSEIAAVKLVPLASRAKTENDSRATPTRQPVNAPAGQAPVGASVPNEKVASPKAVSRDEASRDSRSTPSTVKGSLQERQQLESSNQPTGGGALATAEREQAPAVQSSEGARPEASGGGAKAGGDAASTFRSRSLESSRDQVGGAGLAGKPGTGPTPTASPTSPSRRPDQRTEGTQARNPDASPVAAPVGSTERRASPAKSNAAAGAREQDGGKMDSGPTGRATATASATPDRSDVRTGSDPASRSNRAATDATHTTRPQAHRQRGR